MPIIYCEVSEKEIRELFKDKIDSKLAFRRSKSDSGDDCHVDIEGLTNSEFKKVTNFCRDNFKFFNCDNDTPIVWSEEEIAFLVSAKQLFDKGSHD